MAGTIHSLVLSPRHAKTSPFCFPTPRFLASSSLLVSRSVSFNCNRLISRPTRACQQPDKVGGNGGQADITSGPAKGLTKQFLDFASNNFLPFALVSGVAIGFANPSLGCLADRYSLSKFSTVGIFIISGLTLRSEAIGAAVEAWSVGMFGLCSILLVTPYFSRLILQVQLQPQEFVTGLAIFSCMPTTLSSGIALTQLAGGNSALALAMTVISNLLGILIVPFSIAKFIADGVGVSVPTKQLFRSLILTLLIPLVVGKVPWIQVSRSRSLLLMVEPKIFLVAIGMGIMLHLFLLAFNSLAIRALSALSGGSKSVFAKEENFSALLLVASQKTLPVMVAVVEQLGGALGESGLLVLPCVAAHILQIVMDSFLVNIFLRKDRSSTKAKLA